MELALISIKKHIKSNKQCGHCTLQPCVIMKLNFTQKRGDI